MQGTGWDATPTVPRRTSSMAIAKYPGITTGRLLSLHLKRSLQLFLLTPVDFSTPSPELELVGMFVR